MALDIKQFGVPNDAATGSLPTLFHFWTADDAIATVVASAYFNDVANKLHLGDVIYCNASDTSEYVEVTSANGVTPVTVASITGSAADNPTVFSKLHTTAGGGASEAITATGVLATDVALVTVNTVGGTPVTITTAACTADTVTVVCSADPSTDHIFNVAVIRP